MGRLLAAAWSSTAFKLALLAVLLLGTWLRLRGYLLNPPTLWLDEAFWAIRILEKPIIQCRIRPAGFVYVTKWLVEFFGATESVYRFLPFFSSLGALWLMPYVAGRLIRTRWVILVTVLAFAIDPVAIEMSVEFKHYGVEIGVFVILLALYLRHRRAQKPWSLGLVLVSAWLAFAVSLTVVFLYPALFVVLGWEALSRRRWRWMLAVAGASIACLAAVLTVYLVLLQSMPQTKHKKHWGHFYDVFYLAGEARNKDTTRLGWTVGKYADLASIAGDARDKHSGDAKAHWNAKALDQETVDEISVLVGWIWVALHVAGIFCLLRRRQYQSLLLLWFPLLCLMLFNVLYRWPAGNFRANTFYIPYSLLLAMLGLDWVATWGATRKRPLLRPRLTVPLRIAAPIVASFILVPAVWFRPSWDPKGAKWTERGAFREALRVLAERRPPPSVRRSILLDNSSSRPWAYYLHHDALLSEQTKRAIVQGYKPTWVWGRKKFVSRFRRLARARRGRDVWVMTSKPHYYDEVFDAMYRQCKRVEATSVQEHLILRCVAPKG